MQLDDESTRFTAFYREYYSVTLATCMRRLGQRAAAEDAASEVFRVVWQRFTEKEDPDIAWLYAIIRNVIGNEYRRVRRADNGHKNLRLAPPAHAHRDDALEVRQAMMRLRLADRELLYMAYWEDLTAAEMGEILGISAGAVWVRLNRARDALRVALLAPIAPPPQRRRRSRG